MSLDFTEDEQAAIIGALHHQKNMLELTDAPGIRIHPMMHQEVLEATVSALEKVEADYTEKWGAP